MLEDNNRERVPLDWAAMQNNLGNAHLALGKREGDGAAGGGGGGLSRSARGTHPGADAAHLGDDADQSRQRASEARGAGGGDCGLEEAVAAYRAALEGHTRERVSLDWATTQTNSRPRACDAWEAGGGTARLEEAVAACDAALSVFVPARADHCTDICRDYRDVMLALIAERKG